MEPIRKTNAIRFIGNIKEHMDLNGKIYKNVKINNPVKRGADDVHFKGQLFWKDEETGKVFQVKGFAIKNVNKDLFDKGFTGCLTLDLENEHHILNNEINNENN